MGKSTALRYLPEYQKVFEVVTPWARAKIGQTKVLLSHFPYKGDHTLLDRFQEYRLRFSVTPILHGHTHGEKQHSVAWDPEYDDTWGGTQDRATQIHVGVDAWGYAPVASHQIEKLLTERSAA